MSANTYSDLYLSERFANAFTSVFKKGLGVSKIQDGYNPATWMLEVTSSARETALGIDFANAYRNSELYR
jgi:hypothetical protein